MANQNGLRLAVAWMATSFFALLPAWADSDADALALTDSTSDITASRRNWRMAIEANVGNDRAAGPLSKLADNKRLSASFAYDGLIAPGLRTIFSNRLDMERRANGEQDHTVNTLKQAYLSWQPNTTTIVDAGRVNLREGVALGFNPTDFFKADAVRSMVSIDPDSLRENRLGTVVLRGQVLWTDGSLSGLVSPKIAANRSSATFNPDFGATNHQTRYMLTLTQRLFGTIAPQWVLYGGDSMAPQFGVNLTTLISDATTGYLEYSGGRSRSFVNSGSESNAFRSRLATGLTHTFSNHLSLTIEYDYDGASADQAKWNLLALDPARYWQYRNTMNRAQELMTRHGLFSLTRWQDALVKRLDLSAMLRVDLVDHSRSTWFEARYHWPRFDTAIQWITNHGRPYSTYGVYAKQQANVVITFFF